MTTGSFQRMLCHGILGFAVLAGLGAPAFQRAARQRPVHRFETPEHTAAWAEQRSLAKGALPVFSNFLLNSELLLQEITCELIPAREKLQLLQSRLCHFALKKLLSNRLS